MVEQRGTKGGRSAGIFLGHAAVVVVGSEDSGGPTRRRCGHKSLSLPKYHCQNYVWI